jgi:hypothetical protein
VPVSFSVNSAEVASNAPRNDAISIAIGVALCERVEILFGDLQTERWQCNALYASAEKVPVINAELGDNGNGRWVKFLRQIADQCNSRLVVPQISENGREDNLDEGLFAVWWMAY